ncbi:MAG: adenosylcobinamide-GDP ribazoletransferase [Actinomycetota bacterium]|nr:adenosylcobinamide-GDP ribazoletransferase [Actinomycetota bacterium]
MSGAARSAISFLTCFGRPTAPQSGALPDFPPVGLAVGLGLGLLWWVATAGWGRLVGSGVVVVADIAVTGGLHLDGLADSADGLVPHLSTQRRLEAMSDPAVGAFGVLALAAVLLMRFVSLASLRPSPLLLGSLWALSRGLMATAAGSLRHARAEGGLGSAFGGPAARPAVAAAVTVVCAGGAALWWLPVGGVMALAAATAAGLAVIRLAVRRLDGVTGDVLGASGVVAETVGLFAASSVLAGGIRW